MGLSQKKKLTPRYTVSAYSPHVVLIKRGLLVIMCGLFAGCSGCAVVLCCRAVDVPSSTRGRVRVPVGLIPEDNELVGQRRGTGGVTRGLFGYPDMARIRRGRGLLVTPCAGLLQAIIRPSSCRRAVARYLAIAIGQSAERVMRRFVYMRTF